MSASASPFDDIVIASVVYKPGSDLRVRGTCSADRALISVYQYTGLGQEFLKSQNCAVAAGAVAGALGTFDVRLRSGGTERVPSSNSLTLFASSEIGGRSENKTITLTG